MFSSAMKNMISEKVQKILQDTCHYELPKDEIQFLLHVDGAKPWSWANIRNASNRSDDPPIDVVCNLYGDIE